MTQRGILRNLAVLNYAQGFTSWHYRANGLDGTGTMADVLAFNFFSAAVATLAPGDLVIVSAVDGMVQLCVASTIGGVSVVPLCSTAPVRQLEAV